jgi:hypothetical protein
MGHAGTSAKDDDNSRDGGQIRYMKGEAAQAGHGRISSRVVDGLLNECSVNFIAIAIFIASKKN